MLRLFAGFLFSLLCFLFCSCTTPQAGLSGKPLHQQYADGIEKTGLDRTAMGSQWLSIAAKSLSQPVAIALPYKEAGYFAADDPQALGFRFSLQRGEKVIIRLSTVPAGSILLFADLWEYKSGKDPGWLGAMDTLNKALEYEVKKDGDYLLRVQPELLRGIEYTLTITTAPSLSFPVSAGDNPKVSSFWGANRDAGARSHEGIDIFAKFRTPVLAAADGTVMRVNENNLGGKVVFMRPEGKDYSLYYAHLDSQMVKPGQPVRTGDILGLMGNTGNARTTPPHLHFGIYTGNGAVNPYPFVNVNRPSPKNISASTQQMNQYVRSKTQVNIYSSPAVSGPVLTKAPPSTIMLIRGATDNWYRVLLPDSSTGFVASAQITTGILRRQSFKKTTRLLDQPDNNAAAKLSAEAGQAADIVGQYNGFYFVNYRNTIGWVPVTQL